MSRTQPRETAKVPEGHTIHRLARDHRRDLRGREVRVSSPQGRFADGAALLDGRVLRGIEAYGKHLFYDWGGGDLVHVHLGLFGKFLRAVGPAPTPGPNVRMRLHADELTIDLVGATDCSLVTPADRDAMFERLGPDPLRRDADPDAAWARMQRRRATVGQALMDQAVIAGVGNVYRAEVLAVHGIHPEQPVSSITREQFDAIWLTLVAWLRRAVADQVIITVDPKVVGKPRSRIAKGEALRVYKMDRCATCFSEIRRWDLAGRWAYACETCQPPPPSGLGRSPGSLRPPC